MKGLWFTCVILHANISSKQYFWKFMFGVKAIVAIKLWKIELHLTETLYWAAVTLI